MFINFSPMAFSFTNHIRKIKLFLEIWDFTGIEHLTWMDGVTLSNKFCLKVPFIAIIAPQGRKTSSRQWGHDVISADLQPQMEEVSYAWALSTMLCFPQEKQHCDTNFSFFSSIWDWLLGGITYPIGKKCLQYIHTVYRAGSMSQVKFF